MDNTITVIVETPKGSAQKYNYDPESKFFKLRKILPAGMVFPYDFGFIPGTKGEDGDPLDVIIVSEVKSFTGCSMDCRIIGGITAEQTERNGQTMRNDRFVAIPVVSLTFSEIKTVADLPKDFMSQLESFFTNYNEQAGKKFKTLEHVGAKTAMSLISKGSEPPFKPKE